MFLHESLKGNIFPVGTAHGNQAPHGGKDTGPPCLAPGAVREGHTQGIQAAVVASRLDSLWHFRPPSFQLPLGGDISSSCLDAMEFTINQ